MPVQVVQPNVVMLLGSKDINLDLCEIAARFCTTSDSIEEILSKCQNDGKLVDRVVGYGHLAITEFAPYIFGVENVSRTLSHQLVRKRIASYAQESMRYASQAGQYKILVPDNLKGKTVNIVLNSDNMVALSLEDLADIAHQYYEGVQAQGVPNEDARFGLLEASKTKILIAMNAHALLDFFADRTCSCAQWEIRNIACEMLRLCKLDNSSLFKNAGPKCFKSGFCNEHISKWRKCKQRPHVSKRVNMNIDELKSLLCEFNIDDDEIDEIMETIISR